MTITKLAIILDSPNDWEPWIELAKTYATAQRIWEFINPENPQNLSFGTGHPIFGRSTPASHSRENPSLNRINPNSSAYASCTWTFKAHQKTSGQSPGG